MSLILVKEDTMERDANVDARMEYRYSAVRPQLGRDDGQLRGSAIHEVRHAIRDGEGDV